MNIPTIDSQAVAREPCQPIVVLLVDDRPSAASSVEALLDSEHGIELHWCPYPANAIALANHVAPAVVLQALILGGFDGPALVRSFRDNPLTSDTPVLVLSGSGEEDLRACAAAAGAEGCLADPPAKADLVASIRHLAARPGRRPGPIDWAIVDELERAGSAEFVSSLIELFVPETENGLRNLKEAAVRADADALQSSAHGLKGMALTMGATGLAALCAQIEDQVRRSAGGIAATVADIDRELVRVREALTTGRQEMGQR